MSKSIKPINLLIAIEKAFGWRSYPTVFTTSKELSTYESSDLFDVTKFKWNELKSDDWERHFNVIHWLSGEAFCYYLPSIYKSSIEENAPNLIVISTIIYGLDRVVDDPLNWDELFIQRWCLLTKDECEVTKEWIFWLSDIESFFSSDELIRALETVDLLLRALLHKSNKG